MSKGIFQGYVVNNQDPLMLGRVRAVPVTETQADLLPRDWNEKNDSWTQKDQCRIYVN